MLTAKLVLILAITASFIEPIFTASADQTFRHRIKSEQEIAAQVKERQDNIIARLKEEDPLTYCLMEHESQFNGNAKGKAGEIGWLQFMPSTYIEQCCYKYGYDYDGIKDLQTQIKCAQRLIAEGDLWRWTTRSKCTKYI